MCGSMAKYEYFNGERRHYRGVAIWYDLNNEKHWYIRTCTSLQDTGDCRTDNPATRSKIQRVYFGKLVEAKRFIDEF